MSKSQKKQANTKKNVILASFAISNGFYSLHGNRRSFEMEKLERERAERRCAEHERVETLSKLSVERLQLLSPQLQGLEQFILEFACKRGGDEPDHAVPVVSELCGT